MKTNNNNNNNNNNKLEWGRLSPLFQWPPWCGKLGREGGDPPFSDDDPERKMREKARQTQPQVPEPGLTGGPPPRRSPSPYRKSAMTPRRRKLR